MGYARRSRIRGWGLSVRLDLLAARSLIRFWSLCAVISAGALGAIPAVHAEGGCPPGMIPASGTSTQSCVPNPNVRVDQGAGPNRPQGSYTSPGWDVIINGTKQLGHPPRAPTLSEKLGLPRISRSGWMALASDMISVSGQTQGMQTQDEAVRGAIAQCQAKHGKGCRLVTSQFIQSVPAAGVR